MAQWVKNLPVVQETQVLSLGREGLLEKGMATHSNILTWKIPWTEETGGLQSKGLPRIGHGWVTKQANKTTETYCLTFWKLEVWNQGVNRPRPPPAPKDAKKRSVPPLSPGFWSFLGFWQHHPSLHRPSSLCVILSPISPFYKNISWIRLETHPTPVWPHLNCFHLQ